jgi:hypothetical protein
MKLKENGEKRENGTLFMFDQLNIGSYNLVLITHFFLPVDNIHISYFCKTYYHL